MSMAAVTAVLTGVTATWPGVMQAQERLSFPTQDGGLIYADMHGQGDRGIVLAHGGRFNKESWASQARELAAAGFRVLAIDFRGYGESKGPGQSDPLSAPLHVDVLAAVRYLRSTGSRNVSLIGGSMGGYAAANAVAAAEPDEIERLVLLGAEAGSAPEKVRARTLFVATKDDADGTGRLRLPGIRATYERVPEPKALIVLEGSAHAQFMFQTDQAERVMREIVRFLTTP